MAIPKELLDELLKQVSGPEDLFGKDGLIKELTARLVERALEGSGDTPSRLREEQPGRS